ncbi:YARHG domain-containing protein [Aquimarina amphilecti]|uniref:YARHG domain-containing protein n=1 Tax=Aquimarina amphilecti TaxID=1038014 RepID=A0A1H7TEZ7_AQUAM|nr:YARHG domain-containing protein [Aquimarina amphilecti]SEL83450.1 YARHG domain-containing protein [Aquimarina amphilecti]
MIRYVVLLCMFITIVMNAQESEFDELLDLFEEPNKQIPVDQALKYFDFKSTERADALLTGEIVVKTSNYVILSTVMNCNVGVSCEQSSITSFTTLGDRINTIAFERKIADCSFDDSRTSVFVSSNLLVFKEVREKLDCIGDGKQIGIKMWLEFQPIKGDGTFSKPYTDLKAIERENYIYSHRIFTVDELNDKTEEELAVIKNEIFASHGYMFTKKKWQDYFESKSWYMPSETDAADKLTAIEKKNIELILSLKQ